jgi:thioredoxin reductase (NADPH)
MADVRVYGAPWCPDCRRSKQFLGEQRVPYDWIDIDADPEGLRFVEELQGGGRTIPTIVFADGSHLLEPSNDELAQKLGLSLKAERSYYDLLIVGGGPTGLTAAIYAAREGIDSLVIEKSALGGQAALTERIDNYPGFPEGIQGGELADRIIQQARRYRVELLSAVGVKGIKREGAYVVATTEGGDEYCGQVAIICTGSTYRRLGVPGEEELIGAGIHFCSTCDAPFYKGADELVVIGGGNSGLEEGLFLAQFAKKVRILERSDRLKGSQLLRDKVLNHPQLEVHRNMEVAEFRGEGGKLSAVVARDKESGEERVFRPAAAFIFIGLDPNTSFLKGAVDLDQWGFVVTDDTLQTTLPGVFAAGDVRDGSTKQLGAAIGEGITALLMVRQYLEKQAHVAKRRVSA